ncbi:MAG: ParB/RepB/Spo0J family partition protein [Acidobacteriota bacterium]
MKRPALGKGISALIPDAPPLRPAGLVEVAVSSIKPNPLQPRRRFAEEGLRDLADSIRQHGLLQPIVVSRAGDGGYVLIAGERRWRAAVAAGLQRVPAVVRETGGDEQTLALALIENLQREDLTPIEQARAYHHLRTELGLSQEAIAERVDKDRSTVANALRLLQLSLEVQQLVDDGALSGGHARALAGLSDRNKQEALASRCAREGWSVRELERRLRGPVPRPRKGADPETAEAAERLASALGARVEIRRRRKGGEIRIAFSNERELIRLFDVLARG